MIEVRERSREIAMVLEALALPERDVPDYIDVDVKKMTATMFASHSWMTCRTRSPWNQTWLSNSTLANFKRDAQQAISPTVILPGFCFA